MSFFVKQIQLIFLFAYPSTDVARNEKQSNLMSIYAGWMPGTAWRQALDTVALGWESESGANNSLAQAPSGAQLLAPQQ